MKYLLTFLLIGFSSYTHGRSWQESAQDLNSDKLDIQQKALNELTINKKIDTELEVGLESKSWKEALFVIDKFKKKSLLKKIFKISEDEEKDLSFGIINNLIDEESTKTIQDFYRTKEYKIHKEGHEFFKISFLQAALKTKFKVEKKILKKLLKDPSHEVRMAVEDYFFHSIKSYNANEQHKFFKILLKTNPYQVRMHALIDYQVLDSSIKKELSSVLEFCVSDNQLEVKEKCNELKAAP